MQEEELFLQDEFLGRVLQEFVQSQSDYRTGNYYVT